MWSVLEALGTTEVSELRRAHVPLEVGGCPLGYE